MAWQQLLYDASTGFHDLKPVPEFWAFDRSRLFLAAAVLALFFVIRLLWRHKPVKRLPQTLNTEQVAAAALERLRTEALSGAALRPLAEELSRVLRQYLSSAFNVEALDLTRPEIAGILPQAIKLALPEQPAAAHTGLCRAVDEILRTCERLEFSDHDFERRAAVEDFIHAIGQGLTLIADAANALVKEAERTKNARGVEIEQPSGRERKANAL